MTDFSVLQIKLTAFIKKYYQNELLQGVFLFITVALVYLLTSLVLEYFLWLSVLGRTILFWVSVGVLTLLGIVFIGYPLAKLLQIKKGISQKQAAVYIGTYFPQVKDKLVNTLELSYMQEHSEFVLASIAQKTEQLQAVPFTKAIDRSKTKKYAGYAILPIVIVVLLFTLGKNSDFTKSYTRVIDYNTAYTPKAPFTFGIANTSLQTLKHTDYTLEVYTKGTVAPEKAFIIYNNQKHPLETTGAGTFVYMFKNVKKNIDFKLQANQVSSTPYTLSVVTPAQITDIVLKLEYPLYTAKKAVIQKASANASVIAGTKIHWLLQAKATDTIRYKTKDTSLFFNKTDKLFQLKKRFLKTTDYTLLASNAKTKYKEALSFTIEVQPDMPPTIDVQEKPDSISKGHRHFYANLTDDFGITKAALVYYPSEDVTQKITLPISVAKAKQAVFYYSFPGDIILEENKKYTYYFSVTDNDAVSGYKTTNSTTYTYNAMSLADSQREQMVQKDKQVARIQELFLEQESQKALDQISKAQKQNTSTKYNQQQRMRSFLQKQDREDTMFKKFAQKIKKDISLQKTPISPRDSMLQERLERAEKQLAKNKALLDKIKKLNDKLQQEDIAKKLEDLARAKQNSKRSLEQVLELTKQYYVTKKIELLQQNIKTLSKKQKQLAAKNNTENTVAKQKELQQEFSKIKQDIQNLKKDNAALKKPMQLAIEKQDVDAITTQQQKAAQALSDKENASQDQQKNEQLKKAKQHQKSAAQKLEQLQQSLQSSSAASDQEQLEEDVATLQQILDNLVYFSFAQEALLEEAKIKKSFKVSKVLLKQKALRSLFEHVDDSLFALSLRQPKISIDINQTVSSVYYHIDNSLEAFADTKNHKGSASQQYALTAANDLANYLSDVLDNMQMSMSGSGSGKSANKPSKPEKGSGKGKGFQLSDIIQSQEELQKQMQKSSSGAKQQSKKADKQNKPGESPGKSSDANSEKNLGALYEIYKQQQQLRQSLQAKMQAGEKQLSTTALQRAKALAKKMQALEDKVLEKGITPDLLQQASQIKHELLKLDTALKSQGQQNKRNNTTSKIKDTLKTTTPVLKAKQYFKEVEILQRQVLPLQELYQQKVQEYFKQQ